MEPLLALGHLYSRDSCFGPDGIFWTSVPLYYVIESLQDAFFFRQNSHKSIDPKEPFRNLFIVKQFFPFSTIENAGRVCSISSVSLVRCLILPVKRTLLWGGGWVRAPAVSGTAAGNRAYGENSLPSMQKCWGLYHAFLPQRSLCCFCLTWPFSLFFQSVHSKFERKFLLLQIGEVGTTSSSRRIISLSRLILT